jgi:hypothetical protein
MDVAEKLKVLATVFEMLLHPADQLETLGKHFPVEGRIGEDVPQYSFAARAGQKSLVCRKNRVTFLAGSLSLDKTWVDVFLADFQKLQFVFAALHELEQTINEIVNVVNVQFGNVDSVEQMV